MDLSEPSKLGIDIALTLVILSNILDNYTDSQEMGSKQKLVRHYFSLISQCLLQIGENAHWMGEFDKLKTDFERVCYLLKLLQNNPEARECVTPTGVQLAREELMRNNGKSDALSALFQLQSKFDWEENFDDNALKYSTLAAFYASSEERISQALAHRAIILYAMGLINEAIHDANEAIKTPMSQNELAKIYVCLGQCYKHKGDSSEASKYFERVLNILGKEECEHIRQQATRGLDGCHESSTNVPATISKSLWKCFCPNAPKLKTGGNESTTKDNSNISCSLLATNGTLCLKNAGPEYGWTLAVSRDVKAGEFVLVEKAYAVSLNKRRTEYCYSCFRHCCNLVPCRGCPHVGFCSTLCAENALKLDRQRLTGVNGHVYDCHGVLPCILLDRISGNSEIMTGMNLDIGLAQVAHACIANTDPQRLLDYICSTGDYQGGRGHQAFVGSDSVRAVPPPLFDPSDYSSVAWLPTCSDKVSASERYQYTVAAVFLAYCLFVGGYPMDWREYSWDNAIENFPSPTNRPKCIPACWVAACLLYHLQSADITTFHLEDRIDREDRQLKSEFVELGLAIYPTTSLVNHSCNPSAYAFSSSGGFTTLVTLKSISAGSEISLAYGHKYASVQQSIRRYRLKSDFYFDCTCEACSEGWILREDNEEILICPVCDNKFSSSDSTCQKCSFSCGAERYNYLLHDGLQVMENYMFDDYVNSEILKFGAKVLDLAQSLIAPPAHSLIRLEETFENLLYFKYGTWTLKPWLDSG